VAVWLQPEGVATASTWVASLLAVAVAWLWGENLRNRRARWTAMEERARRLESEREERDRQAVTDERLRIARELHDVVAHSMSVIAVQSGVANHVIDSRPAQLIVVAYESGLVTRVRGPPSQRAWAAAGSSYPDHPGLFITESGFARAQSCGLQVCCRRLVNLRTNGGS
jgi:hypothetical protein